MPGQVLHICMQAYQSAMQKHCRSLAAACITGAPTVLRVRMQAYTTPVSMQLQRLLWQT